ncbi:MAG: hypothetical protein AVDCRST_MAG05-3632, partial [uncultured Rubrobacteraceae bacterium]
VHLLCPTTFWGVGGYPERRSMRDSASSLRGRTLPRTPV